jgi:hypothetical protein
MKLTKRGEMIIYPLFIIAMLTLMGIAGWIEGGI